jgi:type II secretory pathway component PulC
MNAKKTWLNKQNILCSLLFVVLLIVVFFYYQSTLPSTSAHVQQAANSSSSTQKHNMPKNVKADIIAESKSSTSTPKPPTAITPEEKRVVAEKELLQGIVAAGDQHIQTLQIEEKRLHEQDQQAQKVIANLEAQVKGLSK